MSRPRSTIARKDACALLAGGAALVAGAGASGAVERWEPGLAPAVPRMLDIGSDVSVARLASRVWVHTTVANLSGTLMPANGLLVERERDAVLIDTGWTPRQTAALMSWTAARGKPIALALVTHFHGDRLGGMSALEAASIPVSGNPLTVGLAMEHGYDPPDPLVGVDAAPQRFADVGEAFFPGAGHTRDNLTFALAEYGIVFGGCLVRTIAAPTLGNLDDAVLADWYASLRAVQTRYRSATIVVPGHGKIGGDPIGHTLNLLAASGHGP
jgi:metallo-beta-lactamase class B